MKFRYDESFLFPQSQEDYGRALMFPQGQLHGFGGLNATADVLAADAARIAQYAAAFANWNYAGLSPEDAAAIRAANEAAVAVQVANQMTQLQAAQINMGQTVLRAVGLQNQAGASSAQAGASSAEIIAIKNQIAQLESEIDATINDLANVEANGGTIPPPVIRSLNRKQQDSINLQAQLAQMSAVASQQQAAAQAASAMVAAAQAELTAAERAAAQQAAAQQAAAQQAAAQQAAAQQAAAQQAAAAQADAAAKAAAATANAQSVQAVIDAQLAAQQAAAAAAAQQAAAKTAAEQAAAQQATQQAAAQQAAAQAAAIAQAQAMQIKQAQEAVTGYVLDANQDFGGQEIIIEKRANGTQTVVAGQGGMSTVDSWLRDHNLTRDMMLRTEAYYKFDAARKAAAAAAATTQTTKVDTSTATVQTTDKVSGTTSTVNAATGSVRLTLSDGTTANGTGSVNAGGVITTVDSATGVVTTQNTRTGVVTQTDATTGKTVTATQITGTANTGGTLMLPDGKTVSVTQPITSTSAVDSGKIALFGLIGLLLLRGAVR